MDSSGEDIFITQNTFLSESYDTDNAVDAVLQLENMSDNSSASDEGLLQATQALENENQPIHIQPIASSGGRFKDPVSEKETEDLSLKQ